MVTLGFDAPCLYCGRGEKLPGGYVCAVCEFNDLNYVLPVWKVFMSPLGGRLRLSDDAAYRAFECEGCGRLLSEIRELLSSAKMKVCPACASAGTEFRCYWCGAAEQHRMEDCVVWADGGMNLSNMQEHREEINYNLGRKPSLKEVLAGWKAELDAGRRRWENKPEEPEVTPP